MSKPLSTVNAIRQNGAGICPRCGAENQCAMTAGRPAHTCWCMQQAPILAAGVDIAPGQQCWCARCLQEMANTPQQSPR